ncbi:MAG: tRNA (adenosine(37)-N6)-threonylcarbamoyltransferase complex transferase subunit TsaD [Candidatus Omnitrophica bacterium]|nr:tRNA (adenosine(37)-N6)-threonylcarbamoyltransferase complex transferase subunit TsaD [Candidatus Omnitrophota bacterium]
MNILGIETSCDETAASVVKDGRTILSNVVVTSLKKHAKFGGIIPEIASRHHLEFINSIVEQSLIDAHIKLNDIDAVAVTASPGLIGSLLVGTSFARALSFALNKPLVEIDHIKAHLYANFLLEKSPKLPAIGLIVSGGHTSLYQITSFKNFKLLGHTLDDAAGEAFDKVARILNLGYPGGPVIDRLAQKSSKNNNIRFSCAPLKDTFNFSFSGIKTAVLYYTKSNPKAKVEDVVFAFQESVVQNLVYKCLDACQKLKTKTLLVGGGVAANSSLRNKLQEAAGKSGIETFFPPIALCVDNAAMVAGMAYHYV